MKLEQIDWSELDDLFMGQPKPRPETNTIKMDDETFIIEVACPGFTENELSVRQEGRVVHIVGEKDIEPYTPEQYLNKEISDKSFKLGYNLAEHINVEEVIYRDGILGIYMKLVIPEECQPKEFKIN